MNETLRQLGLALRRRYRDALRRPMNWRMIDAIVRLEEIDEQKTDVRSGRRQSPTDAPPADGKVVNLRTSTGDGA